MYSIYIYIYIYQGASINIIHVRNKYDLSEIVRPYLWKFADVANFIAVYVYIITD